MIKFKRYFLQCINIVIGQTGRNFEQRYKEHLHLFKGSISNSKLSQTRLENGHSFGEKMTLWKFCISTKTQGHMDTIDKFIYT
jgi:hypothetical protein